MRRKLRYLMFLVASSCEAKFAYLVLFRSIQLHFFVPGGGSGCGGAAGAAAAVVVAAVATPGPVRLY